MKLWDASFNRFDKRSIPKNIVCECPSNVLAIFLVLISVVFKQKVCPILGCGLP